MLIFWRNLGWLTPATIGLAGAAARVISFATAAQLDRFLAPAMLAAAAINLAAGVIAHRWFPPQDGQQHAFMGIRVEIWSVVILLGGVAIFTGAV